jgi:hypothetical protein
MDAGQASNKFVQLREMCLEIAFLIEGDDVVVKTFTRDNLFWIRDCCIPEEDIDVVW